MNRQALFPCQEEYMIIRDDDEKEREMGYYLTFIVKNLMCAHAYKSARDVS